MSALIVVYFILFYFILLNYIHYLQKQLTLHIRLY